MLLRFDVNGYRVLWGGKGKEVQVDDVEVRCKVISVPQREGIIAAKEEFKVVNSRVQQ